jgi:hypothetical protein
MDSTIQSLNDLRAFRNSLYRCFERRADALFELADALLTSGAVPSPVHLILVPAHRRGWGSLYAALSRGRIEEGPLRNFLPRHAAIDSGQHLQSQILRIRFHAESLASRSTPTQAAVRRVPLCTDQYCEHSSGAHTMMFTAHSTVMLKA